MSYQNKIRWFLWTMLLALGVAMIVTGSRQCEADTQRYAAGAASRAKSRMWVVRECRSHGGIWTIVGGGRHGEVYGCAFPPGAR